MTLLKIDVISKLCGKGWESGQEVMGRVGGISEYFPKTPYEILKKVIKYYKQDIIENK